MTNKFWWILGGVTAVALAGVYAVGRIRKAAVNELKGKVEEEPTTEQGKRAKENAIDPDLQAELAQEAMDN